MLTVVSTRLPQASSERSDDEFVIRSISRGGWESEIRRRRYRSCAHVSDFQIPHVPLNEIYSMVHGPHSHICIDVHPTRCKGRKIPRWLRLSLTSVSDLNGIEADLRPSMLLMHLSPKSGSSGGLHTIINRRRPAKHETTLGSWLSRDLKILSQGARDQEFISCVRRAGQNQESEVRCISIHGSAGLSLAQIRTAKMATPCRSP